MNMAFDGGNNVLSYSFHSHGEHNSKTFNMVTCTRLEQS